MGNDNAASINAQTSNIDRAISRSPPRCPDLDQEAPDQDEAAGLTRRIVTDAFGHDLLTEARRDYVVEEALSWIGTPYRAAQRVKGPAGGVDCLTFVLEVFTRCGFDTRYRDAVPYYPQDWHLHRDDERYLAGVLEYAHEIQGPPEPGDIVLFRIGRCFAHGGIVTAWPMMVHAWNGAGVLPCDATQAMLGGRPRRFFNPYAR